MRQHCEIGRRIASGLEGQDIPLAVGILAIVDAYDAMTSDWPYRNAMSQHEAVQELRRCAGTQFDSELVEQFIQIIERHGY
jgi:HD-GYP domain-containing protein (c-di-GMP phosphodiesterase class II)